MKQKPIEKKTLTDRTEEWLLAFIRESGMKPGDLLPVEAELQDMVGVARTVIREALSRLHALGLIELRGNRRCLAQPDILKGFEQVLYPEFLNDNLQSEIIQLRLVIELGIASFVCRNKTDEDIAVLEKIVRREEENRKNENILIDCDIAFHRRLYSMTGNDTLMKFQNLIVKFFENRHGEQISHEEKMNLQNTTHRDLLENLKEGNVMKFHETMHLHLKNYLLE